MPGVPLGEFAEPPFVRLPGPAALFGGRAERCWALAVGHALAPYLTFLAEIAAIQERLAAGFRPSPPAVMGDYEIAPLAREQFTVDASVMELGDQLLTAVADLEMPATARDAVTALRSSPSTSGIMYHGIEGDDGAVKTETCDSCERYVKIMQQIKRPELEPPADDVGSLGLDILMRDKEFFRGAANPFLLGY
jgi:formate dehydrogenase maturation protein FdhE